MIKLTVIGLPAPQGSKRHVGHGVMIESSKNVKPWRDSVAWTARANGNRLTGAIPIAVEMVFSLRRPKTLNRSVVSPISRPDLSKLVRSTEDALTDAGVWDDDSRVVSYANTRKVFAGGDDPDALDVPGAVIRIWELKENNN